MDVCIKYNKISESCMNHMNFLIKRRGRRKKLRIICKFDQPVKIDAVSLVDDIDRCVMAKKNMGRKL